MTETHENTSRSPEQIRIRNDAIVNMVKEYFKNSNVLDLLSTNIGLLNLQSKQLDFCKRETALLEFSNAKGDLNSVYTDLHMLLSELGNIKSELSRLETFKRVGDYLLEDNSLVNIESNGQIIFNLDEIHQLLVILSKKRGTNDEVFEVLVCKN